MEEAIYNKVRILNSTFRRYRKGLICSLTKRPEIMVIAK